MKNFCLIVCLIILLIAGSFRLDAKSKTVQAGLGKTLPKSIRHGGLDRSYFVYLPVGFSNEKLLPMVIALHGGGGKARHFDDGLTMGKLSKAADRLGIILVYPQGIDKQWCDGRSEILKGKKARDDVGFISALIDKMIADYPVDAQRVYATGISNGGFMSIRLAMDLSDKIAAIAPVTAQIAKAISGRKPAFPISVMVVNGNQDPLVPYDGGQVRLFRFGKGRGEILSTSATVEFFRKHNRCKEMPEKTVVFDKDKKDASTVEIEKYSGGKEGTEVVLVKVVGGGHTWPGGNQYLRPWFIGNVCRDIDACELILGFFLKHSLKSSDPEQVDAPSIHNPN